MQTVGNFRFLLFQIAIKMVSLCLRIKIVEVMAHTICIEQILTISYLCIRQVVEKFLPVRSWPAPAVFQTRLVNSPACPSWINLLEKVPIGGLSGFAPLLHCPWSCLTCVLDLWVAEPVQRNWVRWRAPCSASVPGVAAGSLTLCWALQNHPPDPPVAALVLQLLPGV